MSSAGPAFLALTPGGRVVLLYPLDIRWYLFGPIKSEKWQGHLWQKL